MTVISITVSNLYDGAMAGCQGGDPILYFEPVNVSTSDPKDASITEAFGESRTIASVQCARGPCGKSRVDFDCQKVCENYGFEWSSETRSWYGRFELLVRVSDSSSCVLIL